MIKLGVFGLGRGMYYLQQAENAGAQITAICDMDSKKLEDAKKYLAPGGVACTDFEEFLKADMDGAVLCNYYCEHAYFAARCMEKGIAVLSWRRALRCAAQRKRPERFICWRRIIPLCAPILSLKGFTMREVWDAFSMRRASTITRQARTI